MAVVIRLLTRVVNSRRPAGPRSGKIEPLWGEKARPLKPWTNSRPVSLLGLVLQGAGLAGVDVRHEVGEQDQVGPLVRQRPGLVVQVDRVAVVVGPFRVAEGGDLRVGQGQ